MSKLPCYQCHAPDQGIFEPIGKFLFFHCLACGRHETAKHYRAKLAESKEKEKKWRAYVITLIKN